MKQKEWIAVIIAIIVIAVIISLVTVKLTGDVIKVQKTTYGTDIYTKAEIDNKFKNINSTLISFPLNFSGESGITQLSVVGFFQKFSKKEISTSIAIGGDNLFITKEGSNSTKRETVLSPGSVYVSGIDNYSSRSFRSTSEYLQFCNGNSCIFCSPNFVTKTLNCI